MQGRRHTSEARAGLPLLNTPAHRDLVRCCRRLDGHPGSLQQPRGGGDRADDHLRQRAHGGAAPPCRAARLQAQLRASCTGQSGVTPVPGCVHRANALRWAARLNFAAATAGDGHHQRPVPDGASRAARCERQGAARAGSGAGNAAERMLVAWREPLQHSLLDAVHLRQETTRPCQPLCNCRPIPALLRLHS